MKIRIRINRNFGKRFLSLFSIVILIVACFPVQVFAVDPVSSSIIANAFAQAITAYGASNGVSILFDGVDSSNTEQIGERVHELWKSFRSGQQTADDYASIAEAVFPSLYHKAYTAAGTAVVAVGFADQYLPDIDDFWNWLLSGPAEMVKVDNAYQWNTDPSTGLIEPSIVLSLKYSAPYLASFGSNEATFNAAMPAWHQPPNSLTDWIYESIFATNNAYSYGAFHISGTQTIVYFSNNPNNSSNYIARIDYQGRESWGTSEYSYGSTGIDALGNIDSDYGLRHKNQTLSNNVTTFYLPEYASAEAGLTDIALRIQTGNMESPELTIAPYVGDAVAKPVPIPDTSDPDYGPLPYYQELPIPWNDTLFGDGTGTLTDTQSASIAQEIDNTIVQSEDKTLEIEREQTIPDNPTGPGEVYIPFLPINLPNFNFNLSGIWHYVREWVSSLGSWFSLVFTVWSNLPYALVVPVYATAVIVIVLGVFKRFFS